MEQNFNKDNKTALREVGKKIITPDGRLNRAAASEFLGFSAKWLAERRTKGLPPHGRKIAGRVFYAKADLEAFLNGEAV